MALRPGARNDELPLNLIDRLFFYVRTPEEGYELDDFAWCVSEVVSSWRRGWDQLADQGYVEAQMFEDGQSGDWSHVVRFTPFGLQSAIDRNLSPVVRDLAVTAAEEKAAKQQAEVYESNALFGLL